MQMTETIRVNPVTALVRGLDKDYLLLREAADVLGVTPNRLRMLGEAFPETLGPGHVTWMGGMKIYLYGEDDLAQVRAYFAHLETLRPPALDPLRGGRGRPPMWSAREHADRHRRHALAYYYRRSAVRYRAQGVERKAARAQRRSDALKGELLRQAENRKAVLKPDRWS